MNCYYCGHKVSENETYCGNCGKEFEDILIIKQPSFLWRLLVLAFYIILGYYLFQTIGFWGVLLVIVFIVWLAKNK